MGKVCVQSEETRKCCKSSRVNTLPASAAPTFLQISSEAAAVEEEEAEEAGAMNMDFQAG